MSSDSVQGLSLERQILDSGAILQIGAFNIGVKICKRGPAKEFLTLYQDYPWQKPPNINDFNVTVKNGSRWRRPFDRKIRVTLDAGPLSFTQPETLAVPAIETTINWAIATRVNRYLILHAAAAERNGQAVLLPARSGAGKSTFSAALAADGWRLLSDEFAMIRPSDGQIQPHPRPISLKNDGITLIKNRYPRACLSKAYEGTIKGTVAFLPAPSDAIRRAKELARPVLIVAPKYEENADLALTPLEKADAFMRLVDHSSNYFTLMETGFDTLAKLIETCNAYVLTYSNLDEAIVVINELMTAVPKRPIVDESSP